MNDQDSNKVSKKDVFKTLAIAFLVIFIGQLVLAWQYYKLEKERIPLIEQELRQQEEQMEQNLAQDVLERFLRMRIENNEAVADYYLTERSMEQKLKGEFLLIDTFENYEIKEAGKTEEGTYRFMVKMYEKENRQDITEIIILKKILNQYYIDSVQIAG